MFALRRYFLVRVLVLTYQGYQGYVRWIQSGFLRKVSHKLLIITGGFNYIVASPVVNDFASSMRSSLRSL